MEILVLCARKYKKGNFSQKEPRMACGCASKKVTPKKKQVVKKTAKKIVAKKKKK